MALTNWLIAYHKLDWNSIASVGWNGTDTSITYSVGNGKIVQWAWFNWSASLISIPDSASYKVTTEFTMNSWIKSSDTTWTGMIFSCINTDFSSWLPYAWYCYRYSANKLNTLVTKNNSPSAAIDVNDTWATNICDGTFKMVTVIYDGTNIKSYVNWTLETTTAYSSTITYLTNNYPRIWCWTSDRVWTTNYFNGAIDEVWVWNRWITGAELTELYNSWNWLAYPFWTNSNFLMFF